MNKASRRFTLCCPILVVLIASTAVSTCQELLPQAQENHPTLGLDKNKSIGLTLINTEPSKATHIYDSKGILFAKVHFIEQKDGGLGSDITLPGDLTSLMVSLDIEEKDPAKLRLVLQEIAEEIARMATEEFKDELMSGGVVKINSTIDLRTQYSTQRALDSGIEAVQKRAAKEKSKRLTDAALQGTAMVIDNRTGAIRAMVGGRASDSEINRSFNRQSLGTVIKPFVFAAALQGGSHQSDSIVQDDPIDSRRIDLGGQIGGVLGEWGAESLSNTFEGAIPSKRALIFSKNGASVRVGVTIGFEYSTEFAKHSGFNTKEPCDYLGIYVGDTKQSLADTCRAFTIFPNGGVRPQSLRLIESIVGDKTIATPTPAPIRILSAENAGTLHKWLTEALDIGTGRKARTEYGLKDFDAGGKTGTCFRSRNNWFVGYSSEVTCGVWIGYDSPQVIYHLAFSSDTALPIWTEIMNQCAETFPPKKIEVANEGGEK